MVKTREEKVEEITARLARNGWSSIYSFVEQHVTDDDLADDEDEDEDDIRSNIEKIINSNS